VSDVSDLFLAPDESLSSFLQGQKTPIWHLFAQSGEHEPVAVWRCGKALQVQAVTNVEERHPQATASTSGVDPESLERENDQNIDNLGQRTSLLRQVELRLQSICLLAYYTEINSFHALPQVTAGIKDEVEKSHRALDSIVSLIPSCVSFERQCKFAEDYVYSVRGFVAAGRRHGFCSNGVGSHCAQIQKGKFHVAYLKHYRLQILSVSFASAQGGKDMWFSRMLEDNSC